MDAVRENPAVMPLTNGVRPSTEVETSSYRLSETGQAAPGFDKGPGEALRRLVPWHLATPIQELRAELYDRAETRPEWLDFMRREEFDLDEIEAHAGVLAICPVKFHPDRTFEFAHQGMLAAVIEVFGADDETVTDLVAWPLGHPDKFATALGYAEGLGLARVRNPATYFGGHPLWVYRTPLSWLRARCQGAVVLRDTSAAFWLSDALGNLAAEDLEHARKLARLLNGFFDLNRILVPMGEAA